MGTHALIQFVETDSCENQDGTKTVVERTVCTFFFGNDGYCSVVGKQLAEFLNGVEVVNHSPIDPTIIGDFPGFCRESNFGQTFHPQGKRYANGLGCLIAQYCKEQKVRIGSFGIFCGAESEIDLHYDEFIYRVKLSDEVTQDRRNPRKESYHILMKVNEGPYMPPSEFLGYVNENQNEKLFGKTEE